MSTEIENKNEKKPTEADLQKILDKPDDGKSEIVTAVDGSISVEPKDTTEWMVFQLKHGGGKVMGMIETGEDCKRDAEAADRVMKKGRVIEVGNPHQVLVSVGQQMTFQTLPMSYGDRRIFVRSEEVSYSQFLGNSSDLVKRVRAQSSNITLPGQDGPMTAGGIAKP